MLGGAARMAPAQSGLCTARAAQVDCFDMEQDRQAVLPADYYKEHMLWWEVWDQMCSDPAFDCTQR
jgi:hypothetical protein